MKTTLHFPPELHIIIEDLRIKWGFRYPYQVVQRLLQEAGYLETPRV